MSQGATRRKSLGTTALKEAQKDYMQVYTTECKKTTCKSTLKDGKRRHTSLHHLNGKHIQQYINTIVKQAENDSVQCKSVYLSTGRPTGEAPT